MGMHVHVNGFVPPDERWQAMKAAWDACTDAGVDVPRPVVEFFNYEPPNEEGVRIELKVRHTTAESRDFYDIDVASLPKHVKTIRFTCSY